MEMSLVYVHVCLYMSLIVSPNFTDFIGLDQGRQTGGGGGGLGVATPPQFWKGGLNTCQPPLIMRRFFLGGVGSP